MLLVDLGTELAPAISLAFEHAEYAVMDREPRDLEKDRYVSGAELMHA